MSKVVGVVQWAGIDKFSNASINVDGKYYNTKQDWYKGPELATLNGKTVEFDDGGKNYLKNVSIVPDGTAPTASAASSDSPLPHKVGAVHLERDRCIIRQNSLTNAVSFYTCWGETQGSVEATADAVLEIAKQFEAYSTGDADLEEAKKSLEE